MSEVKLHLGDCLEFMRSMPDKSVDLCLTDPPYGVNLKYDIYNDSEENWRELFARVVPELRRVASMVIMPSCQIKMMEFIYKTYPPDWIICWYKGSPGTQSFVGFNDWEPLLVYGKTEKLVMHDYFHVSAQEKMGEFGHPCPKPVKWATWLIERASKPDALVFDPFAGSGTTAVACIKTGRRFVGCELSPKYHAIAEKRIAEAQLQTRMSI